MVKFEVVEAKDGSWFPRIKGGNGEPWFVGETRKRKNDAMRAIWKVIAALDVVRSPGGRVTIIERPLNPPKKTRAPRLPKGPGWGASAGR